MRVSSLSFRCCMSSIITSPYLHLRGCSLLPPSQLWIINHLNKKWIRFLQGIIDKNVPERDRSTEISNRIARHSMTSQSSEHLTEFRMHQKDSERRIVLHKEQSSYRKTVLIIIKTSYWNPVEKQGNVMKKRTLWRDSRVWVLPGWWEDEQSHERWIADLQWSLIFVFQSSLFTIYHNPSQ